MPAVSTMMRKETPILPHVHLWEQDADSVGIFCGYVCIMMSPNETEK